MYLNDFIVENTRLFLLKELMNVAGLVSSSLPDLVSVSSMQL